MGSEMCIRDSSIPACLRRGGPVLSLAELRHPTDIFLGNQGTASPFCLPVSVPGTGRTGGGKGTGLPRHLPAWHGSQTSTHYGTVTHASAGLGQLQGDAIREIWGSFPEMIAPGSSPITHGALYYGTPWAYGAHIQQGTAGWMKRSADFLASRVIPVAQEIRPVNCAVRYLIRAR